MRKDASQAFLRWQGLVAMKPPFSAIFPMDSCCLPLVMGGVASFERMALSRRARIDDGAVQQHSR